ncbi:MAG: dihydrofolate reductase [Roseovarius sp.]|nr:dihydrofolate reductase [Roseovarius sp.]
MLTLIAARDRNGAIGREGGLPWSIPEDLKFFQRETIGGAVIMGRKTWESLPVSARPLAGRTNVVVSSGAPQGAEIAVNSIEDGLNHPLVLSHSRIYGIGGGEVYRAMLPVADRIVISEIDVAVKGADTWFPDFDKSEWKHVSNISIRGSEPVCHADEWIRVNSRPNM